MNKKIIFLAILSLLLCILWFRSGLTIGGGESGLPFYHIRDIANSVAHTWTDGLIGLPTSYSVGGYYFFVALSFFEALHIPANIIQIILFGIIIFVSQVFIYFVSRRYLPKSSGWFPVLASIFYLFNLVSIASAWNRLQYPFILLYAFLPIGFFLFSKGLEERKLSFVLLINICISLFSLAFTSIPTLELLWILFVTYFLFFMFIHFHEKEKVRFGFLFFILLGIIWIIFNCWWLFPFIISISSTSYTSQTAYTAGGDLDTFIGLSNKLGNLAYVFRLMHKDFFSSINEIWHGVYSNIFVQIATFLIPLLAFLPLTFKTKPRYIYFFLGFSLIILLLMQGSSGVFGGIFLFLFSHIRALEAFRNPFEKFSLLLPFGYAPLVAYSCFRIFNYLYHKKNKILSYVVVYSIAGIIMLVSFPILNRWVFSSSYAPADNLQVGYYVKVPQYYQQANDWLNSDHSQFRVVALPLGGEGMTYLWKYGYSGVEISNGLFSKPYISFTPGIPYIGSINNQLQDSFFNQTQYFSNILSLLNAKYVMTRSDVDYVSRQVEDPVIIENFLATASGSLLPAIKKSDSFGPLTFYENNENLPIIYPAVDYHRVPSTLSFVNAMNLSNFIPGDILFNSDQNDPHARISLAEKTTTLTPYSQMILDTSSFPTISFVDAQKQLFVPRSLPPSLSYSLVRIKENFENSSNTDSNSIFFRLLILSNKRLGELIAQPTQITHKNYIDSIAQLLPYQGSQVESDNIYYFRSYLISERLLLADRVKKASSTEKPFLNETLTYLTAFFTHNSIEPGFSSLQTISDSLISRAVYDFSIPDAKTFEIMLKRDVPNSLASPLEGIKVLQVDNKSMPITPIRKGGWISFGNISLGKGNHELQFSLPEKRNLLADNHNDTFTISSNDTTPVSKKIYLQNMNPQGTYKVSFDYWVQKGNAGKVALTDNLAVSSNQISTYNSFGSDGYNNDFTSKSFTYTLNPSAENHFILFTVAPYNNCVFINSTNPILSAQCKNDKAFYNQFSKPTVVQIKNLKVEKLFTNEFVLRNINTIQNSAKKPIITFQKENSAKYHITIKDASQPFFLVFSESFNPLWQVHDSDTKQQVLGHYLVNSYANAWVIDRKGSYSLDLDFGPEKSFVIYKIIFGVAFGISVLFLVVSFLRRKK